MPRILTRSDPSRPFPLFRAVEKLSGQLSWNASCPLSCGQNENWWPARVCWSSCFSATERWWGELQGEGCLPDSVWSLALRPKEVIHLIFSLYCCRLFVLPVPLLTPTHLLASFGLFYPAPPVAFFSLCLGDGFSRRPHESRQGYTKRIMKAAAKLCNRTGLGGQDGGRQPRTRTRTRARTQALNLSELKQSELATQGCSCRKRTQDLSELIPQTHTPPLPFPTFPFCSPHTPYTYTYTDSGGCLQASLHQMSFAFQQNNKMAVPSTRAREPRGRKGSRRKTPKAVATGMKGRWTRGVRWLAEGGRREKETRGRGYRHGRAGDEKGQLGAPNAKAKALSSKWKRDREWADGELGKGWLKRRTSSLAQAINVKFFLASAA